MHAEWGRQHEAASHRAAGMRKAGVRTVAAFIRFALQHKLVQAQACRQQLSAAPAWDGPGFGQGAECCVPGGAPKSGYGGRADVAAVP